MDLNSKAIRWYERGGAKRELRLIWNGYFPPSIQSTVADEMMHSNDTDAYSIRPLQYALDEKRSAGLNR